MSNEDLKNKASYALGIAVGNNLLQQGLDGIDPASFARALGHVMEGASPEIGPNEIDPLIQQYAQERAASKGAANAEAGKAFLAKNALREGVTVLPSGLQYEVMKLGLGEKPAATAQVTTHYHGTLIDGTVFDSSVQRGQPATFPVNGVIQGWQEALQLMPVGSKWKLFVPSELAYGKRGAGGHIGPDTTLIFEVELISIG